MYLPSAECSTWAQVLTEGFLITGDRSLFLVVLTEGQNVFEWPGAFTEQQAGASGCHFGGLVLHPHQHLWSIPAGTAER